MRDRQPGNLTCFRQLTSKVDVWTEQHRHTCRRAGNRHRRPEPAEPGSSLWTQRGRAGGNGNGTGPTPQATRRSLGSHMQSQSIASLADPANPDRLCSCWRRRPLKGGPPQTATNVPAAHSVTDREGHTKTARARPILLRQGSSKGSELGLARGEHGNGCISTGLRVMGANRVPK